MPDCEEYCWDSPSWFLGNDWDGWWYNVFQEDLGPGNVDNFDDIIDDATLPGKKRPGTIYRLREGIERFFITDINNPAGSKTTSRGTMTEDTSLP